MNNENQSRLKPQIIIPIIVFAVVSILGFVFQNSLENTVGVFVEYVLYVANIVIKNIDQKYLWLQIVILALALAGWYSGVFTSSVPKKRGNAPDTNIPETGRIDYWRYRVYMYRSVRSGGIYFLLDFPKLIVETLAFQRRSEPDLIKEGILSGEIEVPPEVYRVVAMDDLPAKTVEERKAFQEVRSLIKGIQGRPEVPALESDARLQKVATYLEELLEDENDD